MNKENSRAATLKKEGWNRQFVAGEPRLSEAVELYREMGFDVLLEPLSAESECEDCDGAEGETDEEAEPMKIISYKLK